MKNPKNLTVRQKKFLQSKNLNPQDWRFIKNTIKEMEIIHKQSNKIRKIKL